MAVNGISVTRFDTLPLAVNKLWFRWWWSQTEAHRKCSC